MQSTSISDKPETGLALKGTAAKAIFLRPVFRDELYYDPAVEASVNGSNAAAFARISSIESRVARIEVALGFADRGVSGHDASLEGLPNRYTGMALGEILGKMETRVSLLDGNRLHTLARHVKTLREELRRLNEERRKLKSKGAGGGKSDDAWNQQRLEVMHQQLDRWDAVASSVPAIKAD